MIVLSCELTAGSFPSAVMNTDGFNAFRFRLIIMHADDSPPAVYRPAVSAAWSLTLPTHGRASVCSLTNTHASDSIPQCPLQIFCGLLKTDSLTWFIFPPTCPSCLNSHSLFFFPDDGKRCGVLGTVGECFGKAINQSPCTNGGLRYGDDSVRI